MLLRVLRDRDLRVLFAAQALNMFGGTAMVIVFGVWVMSLTGSSGAAGAIFLLLGLPAFLAPFTGLLVDRFPRRRVLLVNDFGAAALVAALLLVDDRADVWLIYLVAFGYGISGQVYRAARGGLVHSMVPAEQLGDVNGVFSSMAQGMRIVGPLVGAAIFAAAGGAAVAVLDCITFLLSGCSFLLLLRHVPDLVESQVSRAQRLVTDLFAGARQVVTNPVLRRMVLASALAFGAAGTVNVAIFALVDEGLGRSPAFIGVIGAAQGAGSVVVGLLVGGMMRRIGEFATAAAGFLLNAAGLAVAVTATVPTVVAGAVLVGFGLPMVLVAEITLVQRRTDRELQGRTIAASDAIIQVPYALAIGAASVLIGVVGYRAVYLFDAVVFVVVGLAVLSWRRQTWPEPELIATPRTE